MWAQIFILILVLGLTGALYRWVVLTGNFGIAAVLFCLARLRGYRQLDSNPTGETCSRLRTVSGILGLAPGAVIVGGLIFVWFAILNVIYPTGSYDDFVYHVPSAAYFVQHHSFRVTDVSPPQAAINWASKLSELFCVWQYFVVRDDGLIDFWSLGIFLQFGVAVYGLCRELGADVRGAAFGTLFSAVSPILLFQMLSAQNDLPMCAFFATALRFAVASSRGTVQRLALAISSGLLLSSKLSAPLLCGIVLISFVLFECGPGARRRLIGTPMAIAWMTAIALLVGGWWYLRNCLRFHNPFYPWDARIAGFGISGIVSRSTEMFILNPELARLPLPLRLWRLWREEKSHYGLWLYNADSAYSGFGPVFFVLGLPSVGMAMLCTVLERRWRAAVVVLMIVLGYLAFAGNIAPRLSLFIAPAAAIGMAVMITFCGRAYPRLGTGICWAGIVLTVYTFLAAAMSPFDPLSVRKQILTPTEKDLARGTFLNMFAPIRTVIPEKATVAYDGSSDLIWSFWRSDWKNKVEYLPAGGSWDQWSGRATALGVTHVIVGRQKQSKLTQWVIDHGDRFRPVSQCPFGAVYAYRQ